MTPGERQAPQRPRVEQVGEKVAAIALIIVALVALVFALNQNRPLDLGFMGQVLPRLVGTEEPWDGFQGLKLTLAVTGIGFFGGMGLGFPIGWMRTSRSRLLRGPATVWVESIRGTPLFVQLLFIFSVLQFYVPRWEFRLVITGILTLLLNTSAYQAEVFRAGLQSVGAGQVEAGKAIGLSYWGTMRHVIVPQAVRLIVPPLTNEAIAILKASSLLYAIGVAELTYEGRLITAGGHFLEVYTLVILLYLGITVPGSKLVSWLERRFRIPGLGMQAEEHRLTRKERRQPPQFSVE